MISCSSACDFLLSENWELRCPLSMLTRCTFIIYLNHFTDWDWLITELLSGKQRWRGKPGRMRSPGIGSVIDSCLLCSRADVSHNCTSLKNSYRYRDTVPRLETVTLMERFGGVFSFPFDMLVLLLSVSWCEVLNSPGTAHCRLLPLHINRS